MKNKRFLKYALLLSALAALLAFAGCESIKGLIDKEDANTAPKVSVDWGETAATGTESPEEPSCSHSYTAWKTVKEPTCAEGGERQRTCTKCGKVNSVVLPAKGHTLVTDEGVAPTCTTAGLSNGKHCSVCGMIVEAQKPEPAWGHQYVDAPGYPASCEEVGKTDGKRCAICGAVQSEQQVIPALGHNVVDSPDAPPGCETPGYTGGRHCARCGKVIEAPTETDPPLGHDTVYDEAVAPTCAEKGKTAGSHCARCGKVFEAQQPIDSLPHTPVVDAAYPPDCEHEGRGEGTHCAVCGQIIQQPKVIAALGHNYVDGFCTRCGQEKPKNLPITGILLDKTKVQLEVGESIQLTATLLPDGAIQNRIEWINESKGEYYTVTQDGLVTAIKPGKTSLTVYVEDTSSGSRKSFTKTCTIEITQDGGFGDLVPVTGIKADRDHYTISVGETVRIEYTVMPANATDQRVDIINEPGEDGTKTYLSIDKKAGTVTGLKPGIAKITLYTEDGGKTKTIYITIVPDDD